MRRSPNAGDVEEFLCGPLPHDLPEDAQTRRRIVKQFEINRTEFIRIIKTILSTKEKDEREDEALQRVQGNCWNGWLGTLEEETGGALSAEQHGFRVGKSTISAIKSCLDWVDNSEEDMVVGIFLDISGAFDNLRWNILIRDIMDLGASDAIRSIIQSYLTGRRAVLSVDGATAFADLTRGCPQGLQLGPSLWNLSMDRALATNNDDRIKLVAYADDLGVLIAGSDLGEIQGKVRATLGDWATLRGLTFSASKSRAIPLKGGLRPSFTVPFGTAKIVAVDSVRYLGIELDSRRNFWAHVCSVAGKSDSLYSRLRAASSADWGLRQSTSAVLYREVFLPRITYAAEIWSKGVLTSKARKPLGSKQGHTERPRRTRCRSLLGSCLLIWKFVGMWLG
ncbi:hypothetical protein QTP88_010720 [Uroleucon formosanum]